MAVTDAKGGIVETYNYTPYGELIDGEYREDILFLYNGQYGVVTDNNGLYYMRARYYNADIKRFINQDVLLGVLERISSLNRYAYVEGNSVSYLDPFGLEKIDTSGIHDILTVLGIVVSIASIFPGDKIMTTITVAINTIDIALYIYDLKCAIADYNTYNIVKATVGIIVDVVSIVTAIIGFNVESFYNKIVGFKGWNGANAFVKQTENITKIRSDLLDAVGGSLFYYTIGSFIFEKFGVDSLQ